MPRFVGAIDQGTTSTRFMMFDEAGREVASHKLEHAQILPQPGWVEHDPIEIIRRTSDVITEALGRGGLTGRDLAAIGVTNQRETTVVWNPKTGQPWYNAIVWQDTRTEAIVRELEGKRAMLRERTGLPPATYFSASKLRWILDNVHFLRSRVVLARPQFGSHALDMCFLRSGKKSTQVLRDSGPCRSCLSLSLFCIVWCSGL